MLGATLTWMEDTATDGIICLGPPGAAKTMIGHAAAGSAGTIAGMLNFGDMLEGIVGSSETNLRTALDTIAAVSQGRCFLIATCNKIVALPPELRRRFRSGTFFFDLPTAEEREAIWGLYLRKYQIPAADARPADEGWTGAEIKQCCALAYRLECSLTEAAGYLVPVAVSARESIAQLRQQAAGTFISASYPGTYRLPEAKPQAAPRNSRPVDMRDF